MTFIPCTAKNQAVIEAWHGVEDSKMYIVHSTLYIVMFYKHSDLAEN